MNIDVNDKGKFDELLRGLSENYGAIYYVDFDANVVYPYRVNKEVDELFGDFLRANPSYEDAIDSYIAAVVTEKDKEEMFSVTRYEFLKEQLKDVRAYSHEYRLERDGREQVFRFKVANLEGIGELHKAVIGFADVSAEKASDFDYYQFGRKLLIVEDNRFNREVLTDILDEHYDVIAVENGQEALDVLDRYYEDIALVLTDLVMPVMDGYELIKKMKQIRQYSSIPIVVITGESGNSSDEKQSTEVKCLKLGASDFVLKPCNPEIVLNRIKSLIKLRESTTMLHYLEKDPLTGLFTKEFFYQRVERHLYEHSNERFVLWASDVVGLKVINENYGIDVGDEVLRVLATAKDNIEGLIYGGRIEGDKFAALMKESAIDELIASIAQIDMGIDFPIGNVVIKHGLYRIPDNSPLKPQGMYDRALLALQNVKNVYDTNYAEYDDQLRKDLLTRRLIAESGELALIENEFVVYYQPKFDAYNESVFGAEALVRWNHPNLGFVNPGMFIPIFEQNGFIRKIDYYVWNEVCKAIVDWKEKGYWVSPISVNVSRRDFDDPNFVDKIIELVDRYGIEHSLLHVEITESAYSENPQRITEEIRKFHNNGFIIELDDFGSGYSSMTAISELDIDIIKLDMSIIQKDRPESEKNVLNFSMQLAQMMNMRTVAEGVETKEQANRIADLGGDYIQGYFYSKPLPKEEFEKYL